MQISRRSALALGAASLAPRITLAAAPTEQRFVFVLLRGGLDGLAAVPPFFDPAYRGLRRELGPSEPGAADGALDLDGRFALHPALAPLHELYKAREFAIVHAVATHYRERSHFDAQDLLENGTARPRGAADGWLNRAVGLLGRAPQRLGLAVGQTVPLLLRGATPVGSYAPQLMPELNPDFLALLAQVYRSDAQFARAFAEGVKAHAMSEEVLGGEKQMGGGRGGGPGAIKQTAGAVGKLLAAADGPRVAAFDIGGWDTHAGQNNRLTQMLKALADGLEALKAGSGSAWQRTVVLVATEFGRTVAQNGTGGTDHGTASVVFALGGAVNGGRIITRWPGLGSGELHQGRDLAPTTDLRAVVKAALIGHLGLTADAIERVVFPDSRDVRPLAGILRA
jgi:uncharacterized protein (DUF1501 family)